MARVNKERALQLAEKAELAAREAQYERAYDEVRQRAWRACVERAQQNRVLERCISLRRPSHRSNVNPANNPPGYHAQGCRGLAGAAGS